jgi:hypothetical protein
MARLLGWLGRPRVRRLRAASAPPDVLLQAVAVLRHLRARVVRCDVEDGTLEARLPAGARLTLAVREDDAGSAVTVATDGCDWHRVAHTLARELGRETAA